MSVPEHNPAADSERDRSINRDRAPAQSTSPQADGIGSKQDVLIGQCLSDYLILDRLGAGGMAIVYKARQLKTDRIVALKTLRERDPAIMERFYREVQTLAKLKHKNIVEALDCIRTDSHHTFLVMEYLEGITLETLLRTQGRVEKADDIASLLSQICAALEHAHQLRIIHRDLKPANIVMMVDEYSEITAKVLDFGIAKLQDDLQKLTAEGQALGSPLYMSPEQCMGHEITPASDVYSLGILSYQLITGELPYRSNKMLEIMSSHCNPDAWPQPIHELRPDLPGVNQINQIIFRALSTRLEERFRTVGEFGKAISFWIQSTRGSEGNAAAKVEMAKTVASTGHDQKDNRAIRDRGVQKQKKSTSDSKKVFPKVALTERNIGLLKLASFLVVAIIMSSVLAVFLLGMRKSLNADGFVEASRFVSNWLVPVKRKDESQAASEAGSDKPPSQESATPVVDPTASAPNEITGAAPNGIPDAIPGPMPRPGYDNKYNNYSSKPRRLQ